MEASLPSFSSSFPKRLCCGDFLASSDTRVLPHPDTIDRSLVSLLALPDPSVSIDLSLERILDSAAVEMEKDKLIDRAARVASAIQDAAMRSARRRTSIHNAASWPLPSDLTVKVFSILDTQSLCNAAAACSMFSKCAGDPLCYCNVDLTTKDPRINNTVVSTIIQRAGKNLRSLKLGICPIPATSEDFIRCISYCPRSFMELSGMSWTERRPRQGKEQCLLTRACLLALSANGAVAGTLLRSLHLYNIYKMDGPAFSVALSVCPSLHNLEVVGLSFELRKILDSVSTYCHSMEHLFVESSETGNDDSLKSQTCVDLVNGCPRIMSLTLRGFKLYDHKVCLLMKGLTNLKFVDFSTSYSITGVFLSIALTRILEERPDFRLLANFSQDVLDIEQISEDEISSNSSSQIEDNQPLSSDYVVSSDSSYRSDLASGSEDAYESNYVFYDGDSFDELEYQMSCG